MLQPYVSRKQEMSADSGCLLWGLRVVIPDVYLERLLNDLHQEHHGMCCIKSLTRGYFWWPGMVGAIKTGSVLVMFVLLWPSHCLRQLFTLGNGLRSRGSMYTLISSRRTS